MGRPTALEPKPKESQWTDDQWRAIVEKGQDILVAAAAGSGKTAVLVERIIKRLTDLNHPIDVDRMLIVTFTNAAAAEMRGRIGQALEKALAKDPNNSRLREQLILLGKAPIMTFHAFCQSVIRKYYYKLDLDPSFRIAEQTEAELIREEVLESLFETYYAHPDEQEAFYALVDRYSNDRSDRELFNLIIKLHDFAQSHPWPDLWLEGLADSYQVTSDSTVDDLVWTPSLKSYIQEQLEGCLYLISTGRDLCQEPGGPAPYLDNLIEDQQIIERLLEASRGRWEDLYRIFEATTSFGRLKPCKGSEYDEFLKDQVKEIRQAVKDTVESLRKDGFAQTPDLYLEDLKDMAPFVAFLVRLVKEFKTDYKAAKRERGLLDFSDLEHDCLELLRQPASLAGEEQPSEVAIMYRDLFEEVLIDEYQDTNNVQETVLWYVSKGGNRFMVGDVKQSIYRFRLAEPALFLEKYKTFNGPETSGLRIDLSQNFRSRQEVLDGTNYIFSQVMDEAVGEIDYDEQAALQFGSRDYDDSEQPVELHLINGVEERTPATQEGETNLEALQGLQGMDLEGHLIATRIEELMESGYQVYDKSLGQKRTIQYRDIVILSRSTQSAAPIILDVLKLRGIPAYAELSTGYFEAVEVSIMMSLLNVIDNPYQDIPLASVLRSPMVGLTGEQLAQIRIESRYGSFYEAMKRVIEKGESPLADQLKAFYTQLERWRDQARRGALADLIWEIYRETGYYDYVAGLVAGDGRQANLKALYDRARQYEQTSFRGLFRFLRFIERLQDRGSDLGEARSLSEQEDVVRIMTIHKSKGLEFPVVFVAGMSKKFNKRDVHGKTLLHKTLGFGTKLVNPKERYSIPTLAQRALSRQIDKETVAEEMRVLYVALTRAREKLILIGSVKEAEKELQKWRLAAMVRGWMLPSYFRGKANRYLDWVGPALLRHETASAFHEAAGYTPQAEGAISTHPSKWVCVVQSPIQFVKADERVVERSEKEALIQAFEPVKSGSPDWQDAIEARLSWSYSNQYATEQLAKLSVTEIKRQRDQFSEGAGEQLIRQFRRPIGERPAFLSRKESTASELGTLTHRFMQLVRLKPDHTLETLKSECDGLVRRELLDGSVAERLAFEEILLFFQSEIGKRVIQADQVIRELPFSLSLPITTLQPDWKGEPEQVMVQGVIDCLFLDESGWHLLDYKTDRVSGRFHSEIETVNHLKQRYHTPMTLYKEAIERIWKKPVQDVGLWLFDGARYIELDQTND